MHELSWLESLNERQREAVTHRAAPLLVLAGPGSGKTRILTQRIAWLIREEKVRPESILAVTFTNRAAEEMRERLERLLGEGADRVWVYTFHAAAVRMLRRFGDRIGLDPNFAIVDEDEQRHAVNRLLRRSELSRELFPASAIIGYISERKSALADPAVATLDAEPAFADIAGQYAEWLQERSALDFDDLIRYAVALLRQDSDARNHYHRTLHHILVDEYQDINMAQYELLRLLAPPGSSITVVADDDQSIYGWRGSSPELIDAFIDRYAPYVIKLDVSYRCPPRVLYGAQRLIAHQRSQARQRFMHSHRNDNDTPIFHYIFHDYRQEQRWLVTLIKKLIEEREHRPGDIAILYRTHRLAFPIEQTLLQAGFKVHRLHKESFFDQPITREIVRYLQLVRFLSEENFAAALNFPLRLVDELTMIQLRRLAIAHDVSLIDLARNIDDYAEISPLTRSHLRRFLNLVQQELPDLQADAEAAIRRLFELLEQWRSPWREHDLELLSGFMAFTDLGAEADELAEVIEAGCPVHIVHPATVDGYAAAAILHHALAAYLEIAATCATDDALLSAHLAANAVIVHLGDAPLPGAGGRKTIQIDRRSGSYALATYTWRYAQSLLIGYETQVDGRFVVYDVETTGTKIHRDEIVELAAARFEEQQPAAEPFHRLVRPQRGYIPRAASRVHGILFEDVASAPDLEAVLPEFVAYVGDDTVVGHNIARFDNRFIDRACGEQFGGQGFRPFYIDTLRLARRLLPRSRYGLESLAGELGVAGGVEHRAARDIEVTAAVFFALCERIEEEKERESLSECLPLLAVGALGAGVDLVDENLSLLDAAVRVLATGKGKDLLDALQARLPESLQAPAAQLIERLLAHAAPATEEDAAWILLRDEFFTHVQAFKRYSPDASLGALLDYQTLLTSADTFSHVQDPDHITMMTLHNAKGTEFPVVIIIGVEHENLPLWRSLKDADQVAEERRVLYVGLTRAQEAVYLFSVRDRNDGFLRSPSRFAFEIPSDSVRRFSIDARNRIQELK